MGPLPLLFKKFLAPLLVGEAGVGFWTGVHHSPPTPVAGILNKANFPFKKKKQTKTKTKK